MPRPRTGNAEWHEGRGVVGHWDIRPRDADGQRGPRECLAVGVTEEEARAECLRLEQTARKAGLRYAPPTTTRAETFDAWCEKKWLATRRDTKEADSHLRTHIYPVIVARDPDVRLMDLAIDEITRTHVELVVQALDDKVRAGEIAWKTAQNVFGTFSKLLDDATNAKSLEVRVLDSNPCAGVRGPDRGDDRQSAYLFPKEATALLACGLVPHSARVVYALAMYTGLRRGELVVLRVGDVVLDAGYINVHQARDRVSGGEKSTKGGRARRVPIEPTLRPLLEQLTARCDAGALLVEIPKGEATATRAGRMRKHLERAKLTRAELHADDANRRPLTVHDLRHTHATWLALRGETSDVIKQFLGHAQIETTQRYIEEARAVGHGAIGEPFPPLPGSLLEGFAQRTAQSDLSVQDEERDTGFEPMRAMECRIVRSRNVRLNRSLAMFGAMRMRSSRGSSRRRSTPATSGWRAACTPGRASSSATWQRSAIAPR